MRTFFIVGLFIFKINLILAQTFSLLQGPVTIAKGDGRSANFVDVNGDGWDDVFISNGPENGAVNYLYLNDGKGNFVGTKDGHITQYSNPSDGASFADIDNDGDLDAIVVSWYGKEDYLYINDGNGALNYKGSNGLDVSTFAETASFGDYNNDGLLDFYVTTSDGDKKNILYKNTGNGNLVKIVDSPLTKDAKASRGVIWTDINNDGKIDLLVVNEGSNTKDLFVQQGNGNYEKVTNKLTSSTKSTMSASVGDIDNDGDMDVFLGTAGYYTAIRNQLFINEGSDFMELSTTALSATSTCTYGSSMADFDNDGDLDIFVANGFCKSALKNMLFENKGNLVFEDVSNKLLHNEAVCSFGAAWGDANNDGFMDILVANCNNDAVAPESPSSLLINSGNDNHWLKVKLQGVQSNKDGIGAKVKIKSRINNTDGFQIREIQSQSGYAGQNGMYAHFGVGDATTIDSLIIQWPSGTKQSLTNIMSNQTINIIEKNSVSTNDITAHQPVHIAAVPNVIHSGEHIRVNMSSDSDYSKARVCIMNSMGKEMYASEIKLLHTQHHTMDISLQLNTGMYFIAVYDNGSFHHFLGSAILVVK